MDSFYTKFATCLLSYRQNRPDLIRKIQSVYDRIGMKLPKLERSGVPTDIDPFTVFGLFNKGIKDNERNSEMFCAAYDQALTQYAVCWNLTMGLYWVRPYAYLNLDSCNRRYMSDPANISANVVAEILALKTVPSAEKQGSVHPGIQRPAGYRTAKGGLYS